MSPQREDGHPGVARAGLGDRQAVQVRSGPDGDLLEPDVRAEVEQVEHFQHGRLDRQDGHAPPGEPVRRDDLVGAGAHQLVDRGSFGGAGDDPQARVERPGGQGDEHVGRVGIHRADQAPGALDTGLPEHALVGRVARYVPDAVFGQQRLQLRLGFDYH
jgi:hypothetical protein